MFEEEAKRSLEEIRSESWFSKSYSNGYERGFQDGAEFGYNKANEELEEKIKVKKLEIQELEKENAEFRNIAEFQQSSNMNRYFKNKKLKDENTGLKEKVSYLEDNLRVARKELTKAKEIIKDYMTIAKGSHSTVCGVPEENRTIYVLKLNEEAEQFIKDMEI